MYDPAILEIEELEQTALLNTFQQHFNNAAAVSASLQKRAGAAWGYSKYAINSLSGFFAAVVLHNPRMADRHFGHLEDEVAECRGVLPGRAQLEDALTPFAKKLAPKVAWPQYAA